MVRASTALSRRPLEATEGASEKSPRVLVVEVDESARSVLEVQLKRDHFEVLTARSGAEALRLLAAGRALPDVVVLATKLDGGEDGYSLCAELKGDKRTSAIPVVMLARAGEENPQALAEVVGVSECLARPLYVRDVAIHVRLAISGRDETGAVVLYASDVAPAHVLRAVLSSNQTGQLELLDGRGVVDFSQGRVLDARVDGLSGTDALVRALVLSAGQYRLRLGPVAAAAQLHFSLRELVNHVFPRIARWDRLLLRSVPLEALLQVDFAQLATALPDLPDAVNGVVRLFDGRRDVRKVLLDSPLHETITLEVITRLYLLGVVVPAAHTLAEEGELAAPVGLFEPRDDEAQERMVSLFGEGVPDVQLYGGSASAGATAPDWTQAPEYDGLPDEAVRSLKAFMTRTVVEAPEEKASPQDAALVDFARGATEPLQPSLSEALAMVAPTPPSGQAAASSKPWEDEVESRFFDQPEAELTPVAEGAARGSVAHAALGIEPVTQAERTVADARATRTMTWAMVAALLLAGVAVALYQWASATAPVQKPVLAAEPRPVLELPPLEPPVEIIKENPLTVEALGQASALYEQGKLAEALAMLEEIVNNDPSSSQAWLMLALARYDSGDNDGAWEAASTTLAVDPTAARAHLLLATVHIAAGRKDEGKAEVARYLEKDPAGKHAEEARALLRR